MIIIIYPNYYLFKIIIISKKKHIMFTGNSKVAPGGLIPKKSDKRKEEERLAKVISILCSFTGINWIIQNEDGKSFLVSEEVVNKHHVRFITDVLQHKLELKLEGNDQFLIYKDPSISNTDQDVCSFIIMPLTVKDVEMIKSYHTQQKVVKQGFEQEAERCKHQLEQITGVDFQTYAEDECVLTQLVLWIFLLKILQ